MITDSRIQRQIAIASDITSRVEASVIDERLPADAMLAGIFRDHAGFGSRDRRHYSHMVFAYFRWRGWVRKLAGQIEQQLAWAAFIDPVTLAEIKDIWRHIPGIDHELAAKLGLFETSHPDLSIDDLMPTWLPANLIDVNLRKEFIVAAARRPPTWLNVEPPQATSFSRVLGDLEIKHAIDARIAGAIAVQPPFTIDRLKPVWRYPVHVQDLASQAVIAICNARPGENWWDACAGSGGKTIALARAVGANGSVLATDTRATILQNLRKRAAEHPNLPIRAKEMDTAQESPKAQFDGVLVDAPCSGLGTWSRNPDARWRTGPEAVEKSAQAQSAILDSAARCVRPGGTLVYSVCTLTPAETTDMTRSFLAQHPEFAPAEFAHPLIAGQQVTALQIHPHDGPCDGMFIAVFSKRSF